MSRAKQHMYLSYCESSVSVSCFVRGVIFFFPCGIAPRWKCKLCQAHKNISLVVLHVCTYCLLSRSKTFALLCYLSRVRKHRRVYFFVHWRVIITNCSALDGGLHLLFESCVASLLMKSLCCKAVCEKIGPSTWVSEAAKSSRMYTRSVAFPQSYLRPIFEKVK